MDICPRPHIEEDQMFKAQGIWRGWGDGNITYLDCGDGSTATYTCQNSSNCTLKTLEFYAFNLYLNKASLKFLI